MAKRRFGVVSSLIVIICTEGFPFSPLRHRCSFGSSLLAASTFSVVPPPVEGNRSKLSDSAAPVHVIQKEDTLTESEVEMANKKAPTNVTRIPVHSYTDPSTSFTYVALSTSATKFRSWLTYLGLSQPEHFTCEETEVTAARREEWRRFWKEGRLLTDRTELLAVYPSDTTNNTTRGGFVDLLALYTDRLYGILLDEAEDVQGELGSWLREQYPAVTQMQTRKDFEHFLQWFRDNFPYYYDRCQHCHASLKEDGEVDEEDEDHQTFVGYMYPNQSELAGKASRTELYRCHVCQKFTRFPRFNSARHVVRNKRGRCGEYSMLLFRWLRSLGYPVRWVIDWADHVWAEVYLDEWTHLDPCEAAVDQNLLYEGWGKKQTYILGFYPNGGSLAPLIADLTDSYTTDTPKQIDERRDLDRQAVQEAIDAATIVLERRLVELDQNTGR